MAGKQSRASSFVSAAKSTILGWRVASVLPLGIRKSREKSSLCLATGFKMLHYLSRSCQLLWVSDCLLPCGSVS